jgi:hypothetical protein
MNPIALTRTAVSLVLSISATAAQSQGVNLTLKLMDFDPAQPTHEEYRDSELGDGPINKAIEQAWAAMASTRVTDAIKAWLQKPDRLGEGMTARDIQIRLGGPGAVSLVSKGQATGVATITVTGNEIDLTTTHPLSRGPGMDPRVRVRYDLKLTIDLHIDPSAPRLGAAEALAQPNSVDLYALNQWATIGGALDKLKSTIGGTPSLTEQVRGAMQQSPVVFTSAFNTEMAKRAGTLVLPGYTYNAGRIENGRVLIAQYRHKPYATERVAVVASWPQTLGELMPDCAPVNIGATWQSGPRPFAGVREPHRTAAKRTNVNPRSARRDQYICSAVLEAPKGAPLRVTWAQPIPVRIGSPHPMAMRQVLAAKPAGWTNPIVPVPSDIEYVLALAKESRPGTGVQSDAATAARRNPLDPVAQQRRLDQVSQPQVSTAVSTVTADPAAARSPATSLTTARTQPGATTSATTTRLQTPLVQQRDATATRATDSALQRRSAP